VTNTESAQLAFGGLRVIELGTGIAAAYCAKMFADAGAEVVKVEPRGGDPMRDWRTIGATDGSAGRGALFGYLAAGKKSIREHTLDHGAGDLFAEADLVITDLTGGWTLPAISALTTSPSTVVVAITPFGASGPYVEDAVQANEFLLQALCGSIGNRGWPDSEPLQAGGRIGEWVAGTFAAVAAAACVRHARRSGHGEVVDLSVYEAMVITMGGLRAVALTVNGPDPRMGKRSLEMPSIVPTADGMVGFCTITAQQFQDFLILIDRPDLIDDAELASWGGRIKRRDEFLAMVQDWSATRTTDEIVELAVAFRIPVAPIGSPRTVTTIDHFVERGVFVESASGGVQPRVPYRGAGIATRRPSAAPTLGQHEGLVRWEHVPQEAGEQVKADSLPLAGVRVTDFTAFWAGPTATQALAALGADVIKVEGVRRPDGMRFSGGRPPDHDQWWETGPIFLCTNYNKRDVSIELSAPAGRALALDVIAHSDLVLENFSPRVMANFDLEWDVISAANPRVTMVRMPAFGLDGPWRDRVGFAQTMEQASGMAWMTGAADGPPVIPQGVCDPVAGLHAAFAAIAALEIRDRTGVGLHIESTMVEAALNVAAEALLESSVSSVEPRRNGNRGPGASPQGVFRCEGDDDWIAVSVLNDGSWPALATLIGRPELAGDRRLLSELGRREHADELDKLISDWAAQHAALDAVAALRNCAVGAALVNGPEQILSDEQLLDRGFWETVEHPVAGTFQTTGLPFSLASRPRRWVTDPAPTYGQHTHEVLTDLLGKSMEEITTLEAAGIISDRPAGL
jgi:crotonobetainyl-CoA:carnitine CoA-transferase CaiB-like acyl-CoA transferase